MAVTGSFFSAFVLISGAAIAGVSIPSCMRDESEVSSPFLLPHKVVEIALPATSVSRLLSAANHGEFLGQIRGLFGSPLFVQQRHESRRRLPCELGRGEEA